MYEDETEESEMRMVSLSDTIVVNKMAFGRGTVFYMNHKCDNPAHEYLENGGVSVVLTLSIEDADGKLYTLVMDRESAIVEHLTNMETYYHIKKIMEVDN